MLSTNVPTTILDESIEPEVAALPPPPLGKMLYDLSRLYIHAITHELQVLDINRYFYALELIQAGGGHITQQALAQQLDVDKAMTVRIIDYLAENHYVTREVCQADKRKHYLKLTTKAEDALPIIRAAFTQMNLLSFNNVSDEDQKQFYHTLSTIEKNLRIHAQGLENTHCCNSDA